MKPEGISVKFTDSDTTPNAIFGTGATLARDGTVSYTEWRRAANLIRTGFSGTFGSTVVGNEVEE